LTQTNRVVIDLIDTDLQAITPYKYSPQTKISSNHHKPHQVQQVQINPVPLLRIVKATHNSDAITQIWTPVVFRHLRRLL